jgi:sulfoquinovose isomerase
LERQPHGLDDPGHLDWLADQRERLLDFYQPRVALPGAGFAWLDDAGRPLPERGSQLWIGARMLHVFALASMLGRPGADEIVRHGLEFYLRGGGIDSVHGGWFAAVGGQSPSDRKELYGQAHILLAASSALTAGFDDADELVDRALALIDEHYWDYRSQACVEDFDRAFTTCDGYRGQNANMHLTEALLAAYEATDDVVSLERATAIARRIAGPAAEDRPGSWRLNEHFDAQWRPLPDYNSDQPAHPFRPYGSQPGHWLEWSKLLLQLRGQGVDEDWLLPAAVRLFDGAFQDAWTPDGGFAYTVDWNGRPVVPECYWWEPAEAVGAACFLHQATGDQRYADAYRRLWDYIDARVIDHRDGSWFPELDAAGRRVTQTWQGKPDLYHAFQTTLYANLPAGQGLAAWAGQRHR